MRKSQLTLSEQTSITSARESNQSSGEAASVNQRKKKKNKMVNQKPQQQGKLCSLLENLDADMLVNILLTPEGSTKLL